MAKEDFVVGLVAGVVIAGLAPLAVLAAASAGRGRGPLTRALARSGTMLSEKARETFAEFQEITEDLVAEMREPDEVFATEAMAGAAAETNHDNASEEAGSSAEQIQVPPAPKRARRRTTRKSA